MLVFFFCMFSFVTAALFSCRTKSANRKKKLHLNLTCLHLSVIFPDEFSTLFFSTYHLSLAHSTVGEGTEALNCNS